jgi:hypothetical protein
MRFSELYLPTSGHTSRTEFSWAAFPIFWQTSDFLSYTSHRLAIGVLLSSPELHSPSSGKRRFSELHLPPSDHRSSSEFSWVTFPIFWQTSDFLSYTSHRLATGVLLSSPELHFPSSGHMIYFELHSAPSGQTSCSLWVTFPSTCPRTLISANCIPHTISVSVHRPQIKILMLL